MDFVRLLLVLIPVGLFISYYVLFHMVGAGSMTAIGMVSTAILGLAVVTKVITFVLHRDFPDMFFLWNLWGVMCFPIGIVLSISHQEHKSLLCKYLDKINAPQ
jgi:hypothetical protein